MPLATSPRGVLVPGDIAAGPRVSIPGRCSHGADRGSILAGRCTGGTGGRRVPRRGFATCDRKDSNHHASKTMTGLALLALAVSAAGWPARRGPRSLHPEGPRHPRRAFSTGYAVNDSGQVAGSSSTAGGADHAFLSGPGGGALQDLGTLGGSFSLGYAVNDSGQVAGESPPRAARDPRVPVGPRRPPGPRHPPRQDLQPGQCVNASGQVAGSSFIAGDVDHAFLSAPGGGPLKDLGTLGGPHSFGYAVNDSGQVAGESSTTAAGATRSCRAPGAGL